MLEHKKTGYQELKVGQEFPSAVFQVDAAKVTDYLKAVEEDSAIYRNTELVPPMALAALALKALIDTISVPPGTIHVSQEFEFLAAVDTQDSLTSQAKVSRIQERGKLHLLTVDVSVFNQEQEPLLVGKTSFVLPMAE